MFKGPFTWKEDDPSARIILESSFGLHAKTRLLGSTLNLFYMKFTCKILCSARLQSKMAGEKDKKLVLGVLPYLLALITAFQHQFAIIYNLIFQTQQQRAMILHLSHTATISRFQIARRKIRRGPVYYGIRGGSATFVFIFICFCVLFSVFIPFPFFFLLH